MNLLVFVNTWEPTALKGSVNSDNAVTGFKRETDGIDGLYERSNEGPMIVDGRSGLDIWNVTECERNGYKNWVLKERKRESLSILSEEQEQQQEALYV